MNPYMINHPLGKNPGDVILSEHTLKFKGQRQIRQDPNLGGNVGLSEFRDKCRLAGLAEGHPAGRNPGDIINISPETRSKDKLLRQRRRELDDMRCGGQDTLDAATIERFEMVWQQRKEPHGLLESNHKRLSRRSLRCLS